MVDQLFVMLGARTGDLSAVKHEKQMRTKPLVSVFESHVPLAPRVPFMNVGEAHVVPHYSHMDIVFASADRPDGSVEPVSDHITNFVLAQTLPGRDQAPGRKHVTATESGDAR